MYQKANWQEGDDNMDRKKVCVPYQGMSKEMIIYNCIMGKEKITVLELKQELQRYDIYLTIEEVQEIFDDYVTKGLLSARMHDLYIVKP